MTQGCDVADLVKFLQARLNEAERAAIEDLFVLEDTESVRGPGWYEATCLRCDWRTTGVESVAEDAAREHVATCHADEPTLLDVDVKRRILDLHRVTGGWLGEDDCDHGYYGCMECGLSMEYADRGGWCETLRLLALRYAKHPDHREEWRP